jgi:glycosyltransferase involved in cell wall biosynthesis
MHRSEAALLQPSVFFTGGDRVGWAMDEDLRLLRVAAKQLAADVPLKKANIVHSVWWLPLVRMPRHRLVGRRIVVHLSGELGRYLVEPGFADALKMVSLWVARSRRGAAELKAAQLPHGKLPYLVDPGLFRRLSKTDPDLVVLRKKLDLPSNRILIGSFQRDSNGGDLGAPKMVKGPDIFLEIVVRACQAGLPVHVVLAGPRRHWLRTRLREQAVPMTFVGRETKYDDLRINTLDRTQLNRLYNLVDLYVVSSRSEGGPHAVLEAAAAGCPILSTRVGIADDVLANGCLYDTPEEAVERLATGRSAGFLQGHCDENLKTVIAHHTPSAAGPLLRRLYEQVETASAYGGSSLERAGQWLEGRVFRS